MVCNNKVYAGRNKIDLTKDTTYDLSTYVTKEDLEKVKGMIDVSARLVHTMHMNDSTVGSSSGNAYDYRINYTVKPCDYIKLKFINYFNDTTTTANNVYPNEMLIYKGCTGRCPYEMYFKGTARDDPASYIDLTNIVLSSDGSSITGTINVTRSEYYTYTINWICECYKYDS